ncbi:IS66 family transposase [Komagataeibacter xylinus]|uniref:IS66 family transposase n=5 Tax=Komagataeibacter TaxID=1434011 RepID=UPI00058686CF|nr:IS66 family transposase [Komagataeibacter rhaeticus]ATU74463.1 IS66 family transposase [Komagataeibacter xylinus]WPP23511.1 IS66 family transposase [Komagataeibacter rhaeticus]
MTGDTDEMMALRAALAAVEARAQVAEFRASSAETRATAAETRAISAEAQIAHLKHLIARMRQDRFGASSERGRRLLAQFELELEDLETAHAEDAPENAPDPAVLATAPRRNHGRQPLRADLPRERVVIPVPTHCPCCGGERLSKLGESVTETLEVIPRQFKVIQTVREKFTCRDCENIIQPPAPFHPIARGRAGPKLLAGILCDKFLQHLPLNRQSAAFAREGIDLDTSTLADWVGACTATLAPLTALIRAHVLAARRLHADDTTVPVLARGRTVTGRLWNYVRDDAPFGGLAPPAVWFRYSRDRKGEHPADHLTGWTGILQSDAYGGYTHLAKPGRQPAPVVPAGCWAHGRRGLFKIAEKDKAPLAIEAVRRIDAIFDAERAINGSSAAHRLEIRKESIAPLVEELLDWMRDTCRRMSSKNPIAQAMNYILRRVDTFTRFLTDGRICLTNNAAERAIRGIALGRKAWLFAGSDRGGERAAAMYSLVVTCRLNEVDPQAWLADVLARINDTPNPRLHELLPWHWKTIAQGENNVAA